MSFFLTTARPSQQRPQLGVRMRFSMRHLIVSVVILLSPQALVRPAVAGMQNENHAPTDSQHGAYDGPAELPRVYMKTSLADTPAPGRVTIVAAGDNLQGALDSAQCGDTIRLKAGTTFTGVFTFPARDCDDGHWIIVRTSAPDSALPPEGTRLTPCYAGVSSLPGRPAFVRSTENVLPKIESKQKEAVALFSLHLGQTTIGSLVWKSLARQRQRSSTT